MERSCRHAQTDVLDSNKKVQVQWQQLQQSSGLRIRTRRSGTFPSKPRWPPQPQVWTAAAAAPAVPEHLLVLLNLRPQLRELLNVLGHKLCMHLGGRAVGEGGAIPRTPAPPPSSPTPRLLQQGGRCQKQPRKAFTSALLHLSGAQRAAACRQTGLWGPPQRGRGVLVGCPGRDVIPEHPDVNLLDALQKSQCKFLTLARNGSHCGGRKVSCVLWRSGARLRHSGLKALNYGFGAR